ncbi:Ppr1 protein [Saccharomycopsis crataegensis]|uniref:Ppr1 protein n=1 Tax=Saccharomycopsis crataegensis TaxID=43959 RepID=A0AAV5QFV7_9ASCO|nr:Ppr1 protein [Saccharomycopsis crataegensis]
MSFGQFNFKVPVKIPGIQPKQSQIRDSIKKSSSQPQPQPTPPPPPSKKRSTEAADTSDEPQKVKRRSGGKHQMAACCACKKKRKKCDGKYPICSGCITSKVECTVFDGTTGRVIPRDYIQKLEETISSLNNQLKDASSNGDGGPNAENSAKPSSVDNDEDLLKPSINNTSNQTKQSMIKKSPRFEDEDLEMEIGYITLGAAAESRYIGDSSAYSIAKAITSSIDYYKKEKHASRTKFTNNTNSPPMVTEIFDPPVTKPSLVVAQSYLKNYSIHVQCQYPFLDWDWVLKCFDEVMNHDSSKPEEIFFIYMIFSIGSQIATSNLSHSNLTFTKAYYDKAMESLTPLVEVNTLKTVQAYLIMSVFSQKMPDGSSIWQTTGLAIRTAVALGLHREPYRKEYMSEKMQKLNELRYRIFWCAYGMERINGVVLGRPFGISDIDIDAPIPQQTSEISVACHVFKLRRIQSSICTFVYKPVVIMDSPEDIDSTRVQIVLELNDWMNTFPSKSHPISVFESRNWCQISYHNSMLLLLRQVVLEVSKLKERSHPRTIEWFKVFTQSASAICMHYKAIHVKGKLSYTWLAMHCVFVAGLSFLYCLWIDTSIKVLEWKRRGLIYDTISACSSILYVLAERFGSASIFRDTFERISNSVLLKVENDDLGLNESYTTATHSDNPDQTPINNYGGSSGATPSMPMMSESFFPSGVLNEQSIGIDQYLGYEMKDVIEGRCNVENLLNPENTNIAMQQELNLDMDLSLWEFLDTTGDKFLRDIYYDMESNLHSSMGAS